MNKRTFPALAAIFSLAGAAFGAPGQPTANASYPYGSQAFTRLIADSDRQSGAASPQTFYAWMDKACQRTALGGNAKPGKPLPGWKALLQQKKLAVDRAKTPALRAQQEMQLAAWLHKTIKSALPHFSLNEGFEFSNAVRKGERQCFLQSTLLAGLLQSMDVNAGVVMVYKNLTGESSNNGHAVTLLKRADGKDIIVDCSEPTPFARHRGLFVADTQDGNYRYVEPVFDGTGAPILAYRPDGETRKIAPSGLRPLDYDFVRSQFDYYRGERTPGGLLAPHPTEAGLEAEAQHLRTSIAECPQNPLSEYMLGRVYLKQARLAPARRQLTKAYAFYARFGRVPQGCRDAMTEAKISQAKL